MALLKSLIQRLLDSRTTPAEAIHADRINLYTESTFSADTFTAPRDGFVRVWAKVRDGIAGTALGLNVSTNGGEQGISRFAFTGPSAGNSIVHTWPIQKGETIRIEGFNLDIQLRTFFDAIGGGYNRFVRRAVLCLKPSFSFSPRSFCKAKNNGSAAKPFLIQELNSVTQQEGMLLQRTDTSVSSIQAAQEAVCFLTSTQERIQMCHRQIVVSETVGCLLRTLTWGLLSLLKKECQSILRRIQSQSRFGSAQQPVGADLRTGGALC